MYVFASDVHLSNPKDERYKAFKAWLVLVSKNKEISKVFLMGDIFDLWLGDRKHFISKYQDIVDILLEISKSKEVHIFEGNHDFQMGSFWSKKGIRVHKSFYEFSDDNGKWLLTHGDLIDLEDKNYLLLRKFFRSFFIRFLIKFLPGFILSLIGSSINTTDKKSPLKDAELFKRNWRKWTESLKSRRDFDIFVCGHYHFRTDLETSDYRALNLGSWLGSEYKVLSYDPVNKFQFISV